MSVTCSKCGAVVNISALLKCKDHDDIVCSKCHVSCKECFEDTCVRCSTNGKCKDCQRIEK